MAHFLRESTWQLPAWHARVAVPWRRATLRPRPFFAVARAARELCAMSANTGPILPVINLPINYDEERAKIRDFLEQFKAPAAQVPPLAQVASGRRRAGAGAPEQLYTRETDDLEDMLMEEPEAPVAEAHEALSLIHI